MCVCACDIILCEHFTIHFHLNCPFGFPVAALLFRIFFFVRLFFFFANEVNVDNDFSMCLLICAVCTPPTFPSRVLLFFARVSQVCWCQRECEATRCVIRCNNHLRFVMYRILSNIICAIVIEFAQMIFAFFILTSSSFLSLVYLGEMNWNPLHIWWVFRGYFVQRCRHECFVFDDFFSSSIHTHLSIALMEIL